MSNSSTTPAAQALGHIENNGGWGGNRHAGHTFFSFPREQEKLLISQTRAKTVCVTFPWKMVARSWSWRTWRGSPPWSWRPGRRRCGMRRPEFRLSVSRQWRCEVTEISRKIPIQNWLVTEELHVPVVFSRSQPGQRDSCRRWSWWFCLLRAEGALAPPSVCQTALL